MCRLQRQPTDAELQQLKVREVLPDGVIVVAESAAIHAAALMRMADRSVLEEVNLSMKYQCDDELHQHQEQHLALSAEAMY